VLVSDVRSWQGGRASIVVGLGHAAAPLNHLGPHNDVETVLYLGLTVLLLAVVARMIRGSNDTLPRVTKPRRAKGGPGRASTPGGASPMSGGASSVSEAEAEEWPDDPDADPDP
jgi:hypothetical protein